MKKNSDHIQVVRARGNGSCGPNSLGIIFCSYLLSDQYGDSQDLKKPLISLNEFAHCWNLYYCENDPNHADYIMTADKLDFMPIQEVSSKEREIGFRRLNEEIKDKVTRRLESMAERFNGYRSEHMQQLIAPLVRFAYLLEQKLEKEEGLKVYQNSYGGFFENLFGHRGSDLSGKQCAQQLGLSLAHEVKSDMAAKRLFVNPEGTDDNSPSYHSFYDQSATWHAANLLGLSANFVCRNNRLEVIRPDELPCQEGESQIRVDEYSRLSCLVTNMSGVHYNAMLPEFVINHPAVKKYMTSAPGCEGIDYLSDEEAYCSDQMPQLKHNGVYMMVAVFVALLTIGLAFAPLTTLAIVMSSVIGLLLITFNEPGGPRNPGPPNDGSGSEPVSSSEFDRMSKLEPHHLPKKGEALYTPALELALGSSE